MRRSMTFLALEALSQGIGDMMTVRPYDSMGNSPFYMPTKSQRVKNKLARLRKK